MTRHVVARIADIPPGTRRIVELDGRSIGILNVEGRLYALRNRCPHQGAPLCLGAVAPAVAASAPGEYELGAEPILRCPWHGWEFDLETGRSTLDPERTRVRAYRVTVEDGDVVVETAR